MIDRIERVGRVVAVVVGAIALSLTVVGPRSPWGLLGVAPLAMGLSGW
jgi:hypothetical protein